MQAIYHWFDDHGDAPPYANLRVPIIVSIATLRAVNPDIPILVLAQEDRDWGDFPEKLNFRVRSIPFNFAYVQDKIKGWRHLSRFLDVHQTFTNNGDIMYVDSDVFWFRDPLPLSCSTDKFCFNVWNTGFYYYNQKSAQTLFDIFQAYTKAAIYSEDVRQIMKKYVGYESWHGVWDEMILTYMAHHHPELFNIIPTEEHASARLMDVVDLSKVKMFHANGTMVPNEIPKSPNEHEHCRGLLGLMVKEFHDLLKSVLSDSDIKEIYSIEEMAHYLPSQFSLLEHPERLTQTKSEDGHFHVKCRPHKPLGFI